MGTIDVRRCLMDHLRSRRAKRRLNAVSRIGCASRQVKGVHDESLWERAVRPLPMLYFKQEDRSLCGESTGRHVRGLVTTLLLDEAFVSLLRPVRDLWRAEEGASTMNRVAGLKINVMLRLRLRSSARP